jgi:hypothetical protein
MVDIFTHSKAAGAPTGDHGTLCGGAWFESKAAEIAGLAIAGEICHCFPGFYYQP